MKKTVLIILLGIISAFTRAQTDYDFKVEYVNYSEGDTVSTDSLFDLQYRFINVGEETIPALTPIKLGWLYDDIPHNGLLVIGYDGAIRAEDILPGDTLIHGFLDVDLPDVADNKMICCVFYGFSDATPPEISEADLNVADNIMCVYYGDVDDSPSDSTGVGITGNIQFELEKVYVKNGKLILRTSGQVSGQFEKLNLTLRTIDGNIVHQKNSILNSEQMEVQLPHLSNGIYVVELSAGNRLIQRKIFI